MAVDFETFSEHVPEFLAYRKTIYEASSQTLKSNLIDLQLFNNFMVERGFNTIDGSSGMAFQYYLKEQRDNCGSSINRKLFTLRAYSKFLELVEIDQAEKLPFHNILKIRQGYKNRPAALNKEQIKQLFDSIERSTFLGIRDYAVYALMYQLGLRVGEVHGLNLEDIDFQEMKLTIVGKGRKRRILPLKFEVIKILEEWLAVRPFFFRSKHCNALFISKKGNRLAIRTMEDNLKKIVKRANLNTYFNVTCHSLRHSFASHLNDNGVDILVLQSLLGHSTPRSTQIYIHPSEEKIRQAMEKLPGVKYVNQLMKSGLLNLKFQISQRPKKE